MDEPPAPAAGVEPAPAATPGVAAELTRALECVLLVSGGPVTPEQIAGTLGVPLETAREVLDDLRREYHGRGLQIQMLAGGYQLCTRPEYSAYVQRFLHLDQLEPLSQAALETLAIIAYRQPVTRGEIEAVRGVRVDHVLDRLLERHLIREVGRRPTVGRPILYGTTEGFLRHFGLRDLQALPPLGGDDPRRILTRPGDGSRDPGRHPADASDG